jgi:hypothetical protein
VAEDYGCGGRDEGLDPAVVPEVDLYSNTDLVYRRSNYVLLRVGDVHHYRRRRRRRFGQGRRMDR